MNGKARDGIKFFDIKIIHTRSPQIVSNLRASQFLDELLS